jgi:hypothetical protein
LHETAAGRFADLEAERGIGDGQRAVNIGVWTLDAGLGRGEYRGPEQESPWTLRPARPFRLRRFC